MDPEGFRHAVLERERRHPDALLGDTDVEAELHDWLDGDDPLPWADPHGVTPDEWFFVTTLYGEMTMAGQRSHIRKYFPLLFVGGAGRDIRNFHPGMPEYAGLRSNWMPRRLARMGEILRERDLTMGEYTEQLRRLDASASPDDPMPALDAIVSDHRASGWKTLSVFVRDCVRGNCFPIDSRVERTLRALRLPADERTLVSMCLSIEHNPREVARLFYLDGGSAR